MDRYHKKAQIPNMSRKSSDNDDDVGKSIMRRVKRKRSHAWTPVDFIDLGNRSVIDKNLQRLTDAGELRRIDRGIYDRPNHNELTGKMSVPDYKAVIDAVVRRDQARMVVDGMTAANDLGLTTAVPAKIQVMVDARLKPIKFGNLEITFKQAAPSRLYWAGRPAMRIVQALHWLKDVIESNDDERAHIYAAIASLLDGSTKHGKMLRGDLKNGLQTLPIWMQDFLRDLISQQRAAA